VKLSIAAKQGDRIACLKHTKYREQCGGVRVNSVDTKAAKRRAPDPATRRPRSKKTVEIVEAKGADAERFPWTRAFRSSKIPMNTKAVGLVVASYGDGDGSSNHPGLTRLARDFDCDEKTIRRHLETLVRAGWMRRTHDGRVGVSRTDADDYQLTIPQAVPMTVVGNDEEPLREPPEWDDEPDPDDDQWTNLSTSPDPDQWTIYDGPVDKIVQTPSSRPTKENHGVISRSGVASATPNGSHSDRGDGSQRDHGIPAGAVTVQRGSSQQKLSGNKQQQRQLSDRVSPEDRAKCNHYISLLAQLDDDQVDDALWDLWQFEERLWVSAFREMRKKFGGEPLPKPYRSHEAGYVDADTPVQRRFMYEKALRFMSRDGGWRESLTGPLEQLPEFEQTHDSPRQAA